MIIPQIHHFVKNNFLTVRFAVQFFDLFPVRCRCPPFVRVVVCLSSGLTVRVWYVGMV